MVRRCRLDGEPGAQHRAITTLSETGNGQARYELRFTSLHDGGPSYAFACDAEGLIDIAELNERQRCDYFYVRTVKGREFALPTVVLVDTALEEVPP